MNTAQVGIPIEASALSRIPQAINHPALVWAKAILASTCLRLVAQLPEVWPRPCVCGCEPRHNLLVTAYLAGAR